MQYWNLWRPDVPGPQIAEVWCTPCKQHSLSFFLWFRQVTKVQNFIYFNFGVLLQENWDVISETEYGAPISIYRHSLDETKKRNFKTLFWISYV